MCASHDMLESVIYAENLVHTECPYTCQELSWAAPAVPALLIQTSTPHSRTLFSLLTLTHSVPKMKQNGWSKMTELLLEQFWRLSKLLCPGANCSLIAPSNLACLNWLLDFTNWSSQGIFKPFRGSKLILLLSVCVAARDPRRRRADIRSPKAVGPAWVSARWVGGRERRKQLNFWSYLVYHQQLQLLSVIWYNGCKLDAPLLI